MSTDSVGVSSDPPSLLPEQDGMSHREIAKRLGISSSMVQIIEARALAKLRKAMGLDPLTTAAWLTGKTGGACRYQQCSRCGNRGHNWVTCPNEARPRLKAKAKARKGKS